jgi:PPK2 family polyphosphate:nucleotide phosphotransferase
MKYSWKLDKGRTISLDDYDPGYHADLAKEDAEPIFQELSRKLGELQELCYAAAQHAVLVVLQGMDTSGKDGTIEHVMQSVNPQGCHVVSFKAPTEQDLAHDFLWRVHPHTPAKGMIAIFNRSHYEDVLIVRVHDLVPEDTWKARYDHINAFERLLADSGTILVKCFLYISKDEQETRFKDREEEMDKRWKLDPGDYRERRFWKDYLRAYEDALGRCSTSHAPWHVIPADHKWFRNLAVGQALVDALTPYEDGWRKALRERGRKAYEAVLAARKHQQAEE